MMIREVTIGRANGCDIFVDPRCAYASSHHGTFYMDGNQLMYRDTSSNGTLVNNVWVKNRAVPIKNGDSILLAGRYIVNWNQITPYFQNMYQTNMSGNGTVLNGYNAAFQQPSGPSMPQSGHSVQGGEQPLTSKWSWGAFSIYPIWGFFNGCWWAFFIWLGLILLLFVPFLNIITPLVSLGICIMFGVSGRKWAWDNRSWSSASDYNSTQKTWDIVGVVLFILSLVSVVLSLVFLGAAMTSLFASLY